MAPATCLMWDGIIAQADIATRSEEPEKRHLGAFQGAPSAYAEAMRRGELIRPGPQTTLARMTLTKQVVHVADLAAEQAYTDRDPMRVAVVEQAGAHTFVTVPMLKETSSLAPSMFTARKFARSRISRSNW